jgi:hypothetical protein
MTYRKPRFRQADYEESDDRWSVVGNPEITAFAATTSTTALIKARVNDLVDEVSGIAPIVLELRLYHDLRQNLALGTQLNRFMRGRNLGGKQIGRAYHFER